MTQIDTGALLGDTWPTHIIDELQTVSNAYCRLVQVLVDSCREHGIPSDTIAELVLESAGAIKRLEAFHGKLSHELGRVTQPVEPAAAEEASAREVEEAAVSPEVPPESKVFPVDQIIDVDEALGPNTENETGYIWPEGVAALDARPSGLNQLSDEPLASSSGDPWHDLNIGKTAPELINPRGDSKTALISEPPRALFENRDSSEPRKMEHSLPPPLPVDLLEPNSIDVNPSSMGLLANHPCEERSRQRTEPRALRVKLGIETQGRFTTGFTARVSGKQLEFTCPANSLRRNDYCKVLFELPNSTDISGEGIVAELEAATPSESKIRLEFTVLSTTAQTKIRDYLLG